MIMHLKKDACQVLISKESTQPEKMAGMYTFLTLWQIVCSSVDVFITDKTI